jgi:hypothetical protein
MLVEDYMCKITHLYNAKSNQDLTNADIEKRIVKILLEMKAEIEIYTKRKVKRECITLLENL